MEIGKPTIELIRKRIGGSSDGRSLCNRVDFSAYGYVNADIYYTIRDSVWDSVRFPVFFGIYQPTINLIDCYGYW